MSVYSWKQLRRSFGRRALLGGTAALVCGTVALGMLGCAGPSPSPTSAPAATTAPAPTKPAATAAPAATKPAATTAATSPAATTAPTAPAAATKPAGGQTAGELADSGKSVFATSCASCHGAQGQGGSGPALIGSNNQLKKYGTGKGLYDKVSTTMPLNAPASLSSNQYLQVVTFLLLQDNFVQQSTTISASNLDSIKLQ